MTQPDTSDAIRPSSELLAAVRDLAFELPSGDPASARLHLLLMGLVQELARMDNELRLLADEVLGDRTYSITGGFKDERNDHAGPGPHGFVPGPARPPAITGRHAGL